MTPAPEFPGGLALLAIGGLLSWRWPRGWLGCTAAGAAALLGSAVRVIAGSAGGGGLPLGLASFRIDALSAWFLVLVALVGGAGAVYGFAYWPQAEHPESAPRGRLWWSVMMLSMAVLLAARDGVHFLIAWEIFAVAGYFLIALDRRRSEPRRAAWLYLAASHAGTLCLFGFFAALAARTGTWALGPMAGRPELAPLFWLALFGFGVKAGLFPLHIWLPSGHAAAPSHVSALMSGLAINLGIYGIVRFAGWMPAPAGAGWTLMGLGAVGALFGIAFGFAQNDLKRSLAYSSVENMGIVAIGIGGAVVGLRHGDAGWGRLLLAGALLHVWNHALFKSLLFFGSGSVLHAAGTREMSRLGGLWRRMPGTAAGFAVGAAAASALPPLNGFVSEWLIYLGLFHAAATRGAVAWAAVPVAIALAAAGACALATGVRSFSVVFLGAPRTRVAEAARECGAAMRGTMLAFAGGCVLLGLAPALVLPVLRPALGAWASTGPGAPGLRAPFIALGWTQAGIGASLVAAVWTLRRRVRPREARRGLTWDCGYAAPTSRMQYTSGAFAGITTGWFAWALRPESAAARPRGVFPLGAFARERFPETVLERLLYPVATGISRVARGARSLHHGRVQFYILYVAGGLAILALIVFVGGARQ